MICTRMWCGASRSTFELTRAFSVKYAEPAMLYSNNGVIRACAP